MTFSLFTADARATDQTVPISIEPIQPDQQPFLAEEGDDSKGNTLAGQATCDILIKETSSLQYLIRSRDIALCARMTKNQAHLEFAQLSNSLFVRQRTQTMAAPTEN